MGADLGERTDKGGGRRVTERGREEREETKNRIGKKRRGGFETGYRPKELCVGQIYPTWGK